MVSAATDQSDSSGLITCIYFHRGVALRLAGSCHAYFGDGRM